MNTPYIMLSTGRTVKHTRQPNGSQLATPTPGPEEMTPSEWFEYCERVKPVNPNDGVKQSFPKGRWT